MLSAVDIIIFILLFLIIVLIINRNPLSSTELNRLKNKNLDRFLWILLWLFFLVLIILYKINAS